MRAIGFALAAGGFAATLVPAAARAPQTPSAQVGVSADEPRANVDVERAFQAFWSARDPRAAAERIAAIVTTGVSFEEALTRVRHGREYDSDVPRGRQFGRHRTADGLSHEYAFIVPEAAIGCTRRT